jgi:DNA mismatch repair protein MutL
VYGRDISKELLPLDFSSEEIKITGFIGKPLITRGNRNFENYFINGRYIKSSIISKAIEEAYKPFLMQHKYPFTSIYFEIDPALIDVNVHPQKLEIRLKNGEDVYQNTFNVIRNALSGKEMIPQIALTKQEELKPATVRMPEPFEQNRRKQFENLGINSGLNVRTNAGVNQGMNTGIIPGMNSRINVGTNSETNARTNTETNAETNSETNAGTNSELSSIGTTDSKNTSNSVFIPSKVNSLFDSNSVVIQANNNIVYGENSTELLINKVAEQSSIYPNASETQGSKNISNLVPNDNSDLPEQVLQSPESINQPQSIVDNGNNLNSTTLEQMNLFTSSEAETQTPFLSKKALEEHRIIGQIFSTYWLVEYKKELYIIDQHAAHEKVLYERIMNAAFEKTFESQQLLPPIVLTLTLREQEVLHKHEEILNSIGYEFEHFGGNEYSVRAVPADLYSISEKELLLEFIDDLTEDFVGVTPNATSILERVASLSCKAAVKANHNFSNEEAYALIKELLTLENPYHCPHGRPVIVSMSQYELERKFKRIL